MKIKLDSKKVLSLMAKHLMTKTELCNRSGLCQYTIRYAINGKTVTPKTLGKIACALDVNPYEIAIVEG